MLFAKDTAALTARATAAEVVIAGLTAQLATAIGGEVTDLTAQFAAYITARDTLATQHLTLAGEHTTLQGKYDQALTDHAIALTTAAEQAESAKQQAIIDAFAAAGVPEAKLPKVSEKGGSASTYADALAEYNQLTDAKERAAYYASHIAPLIGKN